MNSINNKVDGRKATGQEGAPLPVVVLWRRKTVGGKTLRAEPLGSLQSTKPPGHG